MSTRARESRSSFRFVVAAFLVLTCTQAFGFYLQDRERDARVAFDSRRAFDICVQGNENREAVRTGFQEFRDVLVEASGGQDSPQLAKFDELLKRDVLDPLGPRNCRKDSLGKPND